MLLNKVWLRVMWRDERLAWNPDEYGGTFSPDKYLIVGCNQLKMSENILNDSKLCKCQYLYVNAVFEYLKVKKVKRAEFRLK